MQTWLVSKLRSIAFIVLTSIVCWSKTSRADPLERLAIQWEAPSECPDRMALINELRHDLEGSQVPSVQLAVVARVEHPRPDAWQVTIVTDTAEGISDRVVSSQTCTSLLAATSLIIAMMIDPETASLNARPTEDDTQMSAAPSATTPALLDPRRGVAAGLPPNTALSGASQVQQPPVGGPNTAPFVSSDPSTKRRVPWPLAGVVAATTALDYGSLPGVTGAFRGIAGLLYGPVRFEASLGYWLPKHHLADLSESPRAGGKYGKVSLVARVCTNLWDSPGFVAAPCLGMGASWLSGKANEDVQQPGSATVFKWEPDLGAMGLLAITPRLALRLDVDVAFPLNRPKFGYLSGTEQKVLYETASASVRGGIGLELKVGD